MRRFIYILASALALTLYTTSCGGGGVKAVKALQKVVKSNSAKKAVQTIGRSGDDVARHISSKTVTCTTCEGYGQVEFVDDYDNYLYTGDCPDCDGKGTIPKYEFK